MVAYLELPRSRMNIMKDPVRRAAIVKIVISILAIGLLIAIMVITGRPS